MTQQKERVLRWEATHNVRDLGGYPTASGRETCWGRLVRADNLAQLTPVGRHKLVEYGVQTVIDLRMPSELADHPNPFAEAGEHDIRYMHVSIVDPAVPREGFTTLAQEYQSMLEHFGNQFAQVLQTIADARPGAVLFHCMAGKDRTGLVAALLLSLAGVANDVVAADYALTAEQLRESTREYLENGPGERAQREMDVVKWAPRAEVMLEVLQYLDERKGGVEGYARGLGVQANVLTRLKERLLECESGT